MKKLWFLFILVLILGLTDIYLLLEIEKTKWELAKRQQNQLIEVSPSPSQVKKITIALVGDISLGREINWQIHQRKDPTFPFKETATVIKEANIALGNLEGPLIENCPLTRTGMKFCGDIKNIQGLVFAGFDLVSLANNHISNYGPEGIQQTIKALEENKIDYFNQEKTNYKNIKGIEIAFLGFDDTIKPINNSLIIEKITEAKKQAQLVIINFHWGIEYQKKPSKRQKELAYLAIDHGADLIVGHHPHVLQPLEYYQGKPILYSLGNFVFDQMWSEETRSGAIALIEITDKKISDVKLIPTKIYHSCQPQIITESEK